MRIWPVILDSQPSYVRGRGRSSSLLLAPLGTDVLLRQVTTALAEITDCAPIVVASELADPRYADWVRALCPSAQVVSTPQGLAEAFAGHELSDARLFVDPRCLPVHGFDFEGLAQHYASEPRVSHHLVSFERALDGTRESVSFDGTGQIRGIHRYYEQTTWSFIAGTMASIVPCACGVAAGGDVPRSLEDLRHMLIARGVPSRDVPFSGETVDLNEEGGLLAANERLALEAISVRIEAGAPSAAVFVGEQHTIDETARLMGPVIVHPGAKIDANATILGPAVIGAGAWIGAGALVAHATVGADGIVPPGFVVRDHAWFNTSGEGNEERPPMPYTERLARLSLEGVVLTSAADQGGRGSSDRSRAGTIGLIAKRALDVAASGIGLALLAPIFAITAVAIWLESKGPVFYGDKREGVDGRVFRCWKFRSMYTGAALAQRQLRSLDHTDGPHFKVDRDPRVTRVGRFLRAINIDEVPQLFNVLVGQMSLVGPRPSPFRENQVCVPWRAARLSVRPGITGFWQVCRHNRSAGDFHQWIEYDLLYVQHQSFALDVKILAATAMTLGGKVRHVPASWLVKSTGSAADRPRRGENILRVNPVVRTASVKTQLEPQHDATERVA